jgi:hypothetical protein
MSSRAVENSSLPQPPLSVEPSRPIFLSSQALSATHKEETTNHKLAFALATPIFAMTLVATPTEAYASIESSIGIGGGGDSGVSSGSDVGGSKSTGWIVQLLDAIGIR